MSSKKDPPDFSSAEDFLKDLASKVKRHKIRKDRSNKESAKEVDEDAGTLVHSSFSADRSEEEEREWEDDESEKEPITKPKTRKVKEKERRLKGNLIR